MPRAFARRAAREPRGRAGGGGGEPARRGRPRASVPGGGTQIRARRGDARDARGGSADGRARWTPTPRWARSCARASRTSPPHPSSARARSRRRWTRTGARGTASTTTPFARRGDEKTESSRRNAQRRRDGNGASECVFRDAPPRGRAMGRRGSRGRARGCRGSTTRRFETDTSDTSGSDFQARFRERVEISLANLGVARRRRRRLRVPAAVRSARVLNAPRGRHERQRRRASATP